MILKINYQYIAALLLFVKIFISIDLSAQSIDKVITIIENDRDANYKSKSDALKERFVDNPVVDINSILNINLDYTILIEKISQKIPGISEDIAKKIQSLNLAMYERQLTLQMFEALLSTYNYEDFKSHPEKNIEWTEQMQRVAISIVQLTEVSDYILEGPGGFKPIDIYSRAETELKRMQQELEIQAEKNGVYLQLACWLQKDRFPAQPIHIPNFDSIAPQPSYEVDRWIILPTAAQLRQLDQAAEIARANRGRGVSILKELIDNQKEQLRAIASEELTILVQSLENELNNFSDDELLEFKENFSILKRRLESFNLEVERRVSWYSNLNINNESDFFSALTQLQNDIRFIKEEGKFILQSLKNLIVEATRISTTIGSNISEVIRNTTRLHELIESWFRASLDRNGFDKIKELLSGTVVDYELLRFTDQVFKLSLRNIPLQADLDLYSTGVRSNGDRLIFKLEVNSKTDLLYNENREVYMYNILPHIEGTVGVIFADPLANTAIETQFIMAPYYNMILKGVFDQNLRRRSVSYNRMFDWGVGLHVSAPDFDGDDVPELGAGIVISVLHDYIQSGAAVNVFTGDPYWFFGLRLPVPSFNIGISRNISY